MKFAAFFMAEYANMVTVSCVAALLFLGGWHPPFPEQYGSKFLPSLIFAIGGFVCIYHRLKPAPPFFRVTLSIYRIVFLGVLGAFLLPLVSTILLLLFFFAAQVGVFL